MEIREREIQQAIPEIRERSISSEINKQSGENPSIPEYRFKPPNIFTPQNKQAIESEQERAKQAISGASGFLKAYGNTPQEIGNIFRQHPKQLPFQISPEEQLGSYAGDIASFFLPGGLGKYTAKALTYSPKIGKGVKNVLKTIENTPWLRNALSIGRTTGEAGIFSKRKNPEESAQSTAFHAGLGGTTQTLANLIASRNPLIKYGAAAGLGALTGQMTGHPYYGALAGTAFPSIASMLGARGSRNALAEDMLSGLNQSDVSRAVAANERLGTSITPAQASGNYPIAGREGALKRSPEGGQAAYTFEKMQQRQQTNAINKTLDKIYTPTPKSEKAINDAYIKAEQMSFPSSVITQMRQNAILDNAFKTVKNDPAFTNLNDNSYKFLAEVERQLYRDQQASYRNPSASNNSAHTIGKVKDLFSDLLEKQNPDYAAAKKLAQPRIVRRNMEDKLNLENEDYSAKSFYKKFLEKRKDYQDIIRQTKNFPESQQAIKDMRNGWKHLSNIKTVSQSEAQGKSALDQARNFGLGIIESLNKMSKGRGDVQRLQYIYGGQWHNDFDRIMQIQNQNERNRKLLGFFAKIANIYEINTGTAEE